MEFGIAIDAVDPRVQMADRMRESMAVVQLAEGLGFGSVWFGETYATGTGFGHSGSALSCLVAISARTKMRLGAGVLLLPAWNPLKLAYETALIDALSGGRLMLGTGIGRPKLWERFGVGGTDMTRWADEFIACLRALWSGADGYEGALHRIEGGIWPYPAQEGGPPLYVGGGVRAAAERAARAGDGWYASTHYSLRDQIAVQVGRYHRSLASQGGHPQPAQAIVNRICVVAESRPAALRDARVPCGALLEWYARNGVLKPDMVDGSGHAMSDLLERDADVCLIGTAEEVEQQVGRYADAGVTHLNFRVFPPGMPLEVALRTVSLLGGVIASRRGER